MNETEETREFLALKGGTAINLTVFGLPRLSADADLDFNANLTREETQEKRDRINNLLELYMASDGYTKKVKSKRTHILDSHVYSYTGISGNSDNIKVEINYSLRAHVLSAVEMNTQASGIFTPLLIRTLSPVEIFASKIVALSSRAAPRDLYDPNNMVYYDIFNESEVIMLRKCAVLYKAIAGDTSLKDFNFRRIEEITPYKVRTELSPMLRSSEQFDLQAARDRVAAFLNERMALTEKEATFLKYFTIGRYEPQLLFEDDGIVKHIENHPMAMWRIRHLREDRDVR